MVIFATAKRRRKRQKNKRKKEKKIRTTQRDYSHLKLDQIYSRLLL